MNFRFLAVCFFFFLVNSLAQEDELFNRLPGKWEMVAGNKTLIEEWRIINQGKMSGWSLMIKGKDTALIETITIQSTKTGLKYIPAVIGQNKNKPVMFSLRPKLIGAFVFENKKHDYPQRIIYRFITDDSLHTRIEGRKKGKNKSGDYFYRRIE